MKEIDYACEERIAIAIHDGGLSEEEAIEIATEGDIMPKQDALF